MTSNLELIAKLESVVAELDQRMREHTINSFEGRTTMDAIYSVELTVELLKSLDKPE